jgi:hypothetical protein
MSVEYAVSVAPAPNGPGPDRPPVAAWRRGEPWVAGVFFAAGIFLALSANPANGRPAGAIARWSATLARGDVAALRADESLGMRAWIDALVDELGARDHQRVLDIVVRAEIAGQAQLARLREETNRAGVAAFEALPYAQQRAVSQQSHDAWVCAQGVTQVSEAAPVGGCDALLAEPPSYAVVMRLGTASLDADAQALLAGRAGNDPAVVADPMLAQFAERRDREGGRALATLRERVWSAGEREFRRLPGSQRREIDNRSGVRFVRDRGFATLAAAERAQVGSVDALFDNGDAVAARLGIASLTPAERQEVAGRTRAAHLEGRAAWVEAAGTRLAQDLLIRTFRAAHYELDALVVQGAGGRDLIRRQRTDARLRWSLLGSDLRNQPTGVTLRWSSQKVRWDVADVHWTPRDASAAAPAPILPGADADAGATEASP